MRPGLSDMTRLVAEDSENTTVAGDPQLTASASWKPRLVRLEGVSDFFQSLLDFSVSGGNEPFGLVLYSTPGVGSEGPGEIELVDLRSRKTIARGLSLLGTKRLLLSHSGKYVGTIQETGLGHSSMHQLDFGKLMASKLIIT